MSTLFVPQVCLRCIAGTWGRDLSHTSVAGRCWDDRCGGVECGRVDPGRECEDGFGT